MRLIYLSPRLFTYFSEIKGWILCILSAILLILSFPCANLEFLAWFAFVPIFFAIKNKSKGKAFLLFFIMGIVFWSGIIYWLIHVTLPGAIILIIYLALYFAVFGLIVSRFALFPNSLFFFFIPAVWVLLEYLRSHLFTGFGWALMGYSQYLNLPFIQVSDIGGVWIVSFLLMMTNALLFSILDIQYLVLFKKQKTRLSVIHFASALVILSLSLGYGFYKIHQPAGSLQGKAVKISVIQGNIPQAIKWEHSASGAILREYFRLSELATLDDPDLIIWPEAALPGILQGESGLKKDLQEFAYNIRPALLLGAVNSSGENYYNSAIMFSAADDYIQRYDKIHLVPFGEYIPLKKALPFLQTVVPIGDFSRGQEYQLFSLDNGIKFAVLICFEDIFAELSREFVKRGAGLLVNITNDAWFLDTSSPYQHLSASVFRAVENRVWLARAANTGISGFINPAGKVSPFIDYNSGKQTFISGHKTAIVSGDLHKGHTLYTQWGDWFVALCALITLIGCILRTKSILP